jgi:MOSC domain-containing protein YiiM
MASAWVVSVNVGREADLLIGGKPGRTAIDKQAVAGPTAIASLGLAGDEQADKENHGGGDQALYAYAREDLDWWTAQLGRELRSGLFGENITTVGIDVNSALIGETWRVGTTVVQITSPRIPCVTFQSWLDEPHWVKRFAAAGRPGAYLRVLTDGSIQAGDEIEVLGRPDVQVTVTESMQAFYGDRELLRRLLMVPGRGFKWDEIAEAVLSRA